MTKKKFKINLFDIVLIIIVLAAILVGYKFTHKEVAVETKTIRYTFELTDNDEGFTDLISVGDEITDNIKNYYMGRVVDVKKVPYTELVDSQELGKVVETEIPGRETAIVTVEANVTENGPDLKVNGYFTVKGGLEIAVKGLGYAGRGYILTVEREAAEQ
ncbi:DUF4330 domain-containing protein [Anaerotignum faecicola]|nr:DUF4330 domain-containing protein [Anaerotignum faecicola]